jgi:hypothetical protein
MARSPPESDRRPSCCRILHRAMSPEELKLTQRLALLKQQERDLRNQFSQAHSTLAKTDEIELSLIAVGLEIAELERTLAAAKPK